MDLKINSVNYDSICVEMCREEELKRKHEKRLRGNIISKKTAAVFYSADVFARFFYCP